MLEEAIKENTAVLRELLARLSHVGNAVAAPAAPAATEAPKADRVVKTDLGTVVQPANTGKALNYDTDIKPVALALAKKNRPALTAIWAEFKVKVGSELKPEQFEAALAAINKASA